MKMTNRSRIYKTIIHKGSYLSLLFLKMYLQNV